tara:strand:+ start:387 stop:611 length:225 start_codon:yes stop_codon:yes gene_type:complete
MSINEFSVLVTKEEKGDKNSKELDIADMSRLLKIINKIIGANRFYNLINRFLKEQENNRELAKFIEEKTKNNNE